MRSIQWSKKCKGYEIQARTFPTLLGYGELLLQKGNGFSIKDSARYGVFFDLTLPSRAVKLRSYKLEGFVSFLSFTHPKSFWIPQGTEFFSCGYQERLGLNRYNIFNINCKIVLKYLRNIAARKLKNSCYVTGGKWSLLIGSNSIGLMFVQNVQLSLIGTMSRNWHSNTIIIGSSGSALSFFNLHFKLFNF